MTGKEKPKMYTTQENYKPLGSVGNMQENCAQVCVDWENGRKEESANCKSGETGETPWRNTRNLIIDNLEVFEHC